MSRPHNKYILKNIWPANYFNLKCDQLHLNLLMKISISGESSFLSRIYTFNLPKIINFIRSKCKLITKLIATIFCGMNAMQKKPSKLYTIVLIDCIYGECEVYVFGFMILIDGTHVFPQKIPKLILDVLFFFCMTNNFF